MLVETDDEVHRARFVFIDPIFGTHARYIAWAIWGALVIVATMVTAALPGVTVTAATFAISLAAALVLTWYGVMPFVDADHTVSSVAHTVTAEAASRRREAKPQTVTHRPGRVRVRHEQESAR